MTILDKMEALATCLCAQIITDGRPKVCFCGLQPGAAVAYDYVTACDDEGCGMAWVRLIQSAPTTGIGIISELVGNCGAELGFDIEVGMIRCCPVMVPGGEPPEASEVLAVTQEQMADMLTMRTAIACCDALGDFILGSYTPFGPEGGAVGGAWIVTASED